MQLTQVWSLVSQALPGVDPEHHGYGSPQTKIQAKKSRRLISEIGSLHLFSHFLDNKFYFLYYFVTLAKKFSCSSLPFSILPLLSSSSLNVIGQSPHSIFYHHSRVFKRLRWESIFLHPAALWSLRMNTLTHSFFHVSQAW